MILRDAARNPRRGLTLTEILISIMIMGIGLLSLATLFPLGLLRLRDANRSSRSALLAASAGSDLTASALLSKPAYTALYEGFWTNQYGAGTYFSPADPFLQDPSLPAGLIKPYGAGVPVCIDPLWWYQIEVQSAGATNRGNTQARFGSGIGFVRPDPDGDTASAHGLPRLSPFQFGVDVTQFFASTDDLVYQTEGSPNPVQGYGSTLVPVMDPTPMTMATPMGPRPVADLSFTWIFTGRQTDAGNGLTFDGDIVILHNRPYSIDPANGPYGGTARAANEVVVEAIWGYGPPPPPAPMGYSNNDTSVLLRWPASLSDPEIRVGGWIADVTYERYSAVVASRFGGAFNYPAQRCHWYRIVRRSEPTPAIPFAGDSGPYKQVIVTIDRPVRARTLMAAGTPPMPVHVEAALVHPNVVMVYPKVLVVK